jgi:amidase
VNGETRSYEEQLVWASVVGMAYLPATAAPVGRTAGGLPVGVQIVGPYCEDRTPIDVARRMAEVMGGFEIPPAFAA